MNRKGDKNCREFDSNKDEIVGELHKGNGIASSLVRTEKTATLKLINSILSNYIIFIQSPSRQDSILKTIQYSLWLLSKFYRGSRKGQQIPHRVAESLLKLQGEISWARYLLRFFGFPAAIQDAGQNCNWTTENTSHRIGRVMSWTMVAYYPLEHLAYLLWKAPGIRWLPMFAPTPTKNQDVAATCPSNGYSSAQLANKASAWSTRFWLTWIILDIVRGTMALREINKVRKALKDKDKDKDVLAKVKSKQMTLLRNALYLLPAITWSLPQWDTQPLLSGDVVNGFCWLESIVGLYQVIHDYQKM